VPVPGLVIRRAVEGDLPAIVSLLADDFLGAEREQAGADPPDSYRQAFQEIDRDARNELIVAEIEGRVVATLQLTFIPSLSHQGSERMEIEAVRVASDLRGRGIGHQLLAWAIERGRERGCRLVQLTTNKRRVDARRFYESLGFVASHEGMKLDLL
jgi:GNAT superfamily N-acetyltransferase